MGKNRGTLLHRGTLGLLLVWGIGTILLLRRIGDPSLHCCDAAQHLMDGVFMKDFLQEMPILNIYEFTSNYYVQYPALAIGYRPPFFPFIEGIFNGIFGVHIWSSRLSILAFTLVGVGAWYKLIERIFDTGTAFWASLLLLTTPFLVQWGWYAMGELPVLSMVLLTAYSFYLFTENKRSRYLYATAILLGVAVWTKQTAVFVLLWFTLYVALKGEFLEYVKRRDVWIAILIVLGFMIPLGFMTLWLSGQNVKQSVGQGDFANPALRLSMLNLIWYVRILIKVQVSIAVFILSLVGLGWTAWKREKRGHYFFLLIVAAYVFLLICMPKILAIRSSGYPPLHFFRHCRGTM